ncbi:hypothetical protein [Rickettsia hoogstraalii]|uniref:hypothetical protein n=1 Tax=Rickettsia hoogstraalii TaxID=467174 RepID=UPI000A3EE11C|nr:hypothetical protein [Rickettsia hoogstraalii]
MREELRSNSTKQSQDFCTRLPRRFAPRNDDSSPLIIYNPLQSYKLQIKLIKLP